MNGVAGVGDNEGMGKEGAEFFIPFSHEDMIDGEMGLMGQAVIEERGGEGRDILLSSHRKVGPKGLKKGLIVPPFQKLVNRECVEKLSPLLISL